MSPVSCQRVTRLDISRFQCCWATTESFAIPHYTPVRQVTIRLWNGLTGETDRNQGDMNLSWSHPEFHLSIPLSNHNHCCVSTQIGGPPPSTFVLEFTATQSPSHVQWPVGHHWVILAQQVRQQMSSFRMHTRQHINLPTHTPGGCSDWVIIRDDY